MPRNTCFSVGYFAGRKSTKKCLVSEEDLIAMYSELGQAMCACGVMGVLTGKSEETQKRW